MFSWISAHSGFGKSLSPRDKSYIKPFIILISVMHDCEIFVLNPHELIQPLNWLSRKTLKNGIIAIS